jgi:hypothetical protein
LFVGVEALGGFEGEAEVVGGAAFGFVEDERTCMGTSWLLSRT